MQKIIKGSRYNTDTAKKVAVISDGIILQRSKSGNFFIFDGEKIIPVTEIEAKRLASDVMDTEAFFSAFEDNSPEHRITVYLPERLLKRLDSAAVGNVSRSDIVIAALNLYLK